MVHVEISDAISGIDHHVAFNAFATIWTRLDALW